MYYNMETIVFSNILNIHISDNSILHCHRLHCFVVLDTECYPRDLHVTFTRDRYK